MKTTAITNLLALVLALSRGTSAQCRDFWSGRAPFCRGGPCPPGHVESEQSDWGDGGYCVTGKKVLCKCEVALGSPGPCTPEPAKTSCYGLIMWCNNGCSTYACGLCAGFWEDFRKRDALPGGGYRYPPPRSYPHSKPYHKYCETPREELVDSIHQVPEDRLERALASMDVPIPENYDDRAIYDLAEMVLDSQLELLGLVNANASYANWGDPNTYVPSTSLECESGQAQGDDDMAV